jgi:glutaredoxin
MQILRPLAALLALLACLAAPLAAQSKDVRKNDPSLCPWCKGDKALMEKAGIASHGEFAFGKEESTRKVDGVLPTCEIKWIETAHFEIGIALAPHKVKQEEKEKIRTELARLQQVLPDVDPKSKILDPWLRAHLYAQRCEEIYARMVEILGAKELAFPPKGTLYDGTGMYLGCGPHLGQGGKYEVLIVPAEANLTGYLQSQFGLLTKKTQRWNLNAADTLSVTIHCAEEGLREDEGLHGHLGFNLAINLFDGFKHYSYDTPIWLREGLAHMVEREIGPRFNSFDSAEGGIAQTTRKEKWEPEVRKLVAGGKAPRMAELMSMKEYSDLTLDRHYATWSMVQYLVKQKPAEFAKFCGALKGRLNAKRITDGSNMPEAHREFFKEHLGLSYADFDRAWSEWVLATYGAQ